ncbi:YesL family protein [Kribbella sancticallisti]|uniref:YesL family protein n=1 Tax=Kribbella sancticallisti TaxID=460087 RepID=A0ABP4PH12_9ACTN
MSSPGWSIRFYEAADELVWAIKLNFLWIGFTLLGGVALGIGPATLTAYNLARRRSFGESFHAWPAFRAGFRRDFARGSLLVLPLLALAVVLVGNYLYFASLGAAAAIPRLACFAALVVLTVITAYLLPLAVHYDLRTRELLPKASLVAISRPASSIVLLFVLATIGYLSKTFPVFGLVLAAGGWIQLNTWLCLRFFAENEARLHLKGNS